MTPGTPPQGIDRDALARRFHEAYERLAPSFGYKTREASAVPWEDVPEQNKRLMVAVAGEVLALVRPVEGVVLSREEVALLLQGEHAWPQAAAPVLARLRAARLEAAQ
jgi:hypothetical protein